MSNSATISEKLDGLLTAFNDRDIDAVMRNFAADCAL